MISVISTAAACFVATIAINYSKAQAMKNKELEEVTPQGYRVMRGKSYNKLITYTSLIFGVGAIGLSIIYMTINTFYSFIGIMLGAFFVVMGLLIKKMTKDNKIEYNSEEIKQYKVFRKNPIVIKWSDIVKVEVKRIGPLILVNDGKRKAFINLTFDGSLQFVRVAMEKFKDNGVKIPNELLEIIKGNY